MLLKKYLAVDDQSINTEFVLDVLHCKNSGPDYKKNYGKSSKARLLKKILNPIELLHAVQQSFQSPSWLGEPNLREVKLFRIKGTSLHGVYPCHSTLMLWVVGIK
jgi:hypothetical protein